VQSSRNLFYRPEDGGSTFLRIIGTFMLHITASHPRIFLTVSAAVNPNLKQKQLLLQRDLSKANATSYSLFVPLTGHGGRRGPGTHSVLRINDTGYNFVLLFRQPEGSGSCMQTFPRMASRGWSVCR
jgi:hypothetical protein